MSKPQGLKLYLAPGTTLPRWLRRAMRDEKRGIRLRHLPLGPRGKRGPRVRCLVIPNAEARVLGGGGCIELKVPGEVVFQNGLYAGEILSIQDFAGRPVILNVRMCMACLLPTGVHVPGTNEIRCSSCKREWFDEPAESKEREELDVL